MLVIPAYNEAERLSPQAFLDHADSRPTRVLFVNDGSTDATGGILGQIVEADPTRFGLLNLENNAGKAEAVRIGLLQTLGSGPDYVGYWDADLATPLSAVSPMCAVLDERPEVQMVLGSRVKLMGRTIERRASRHYLGRIFATFASLILKLPIYDTQCGAKVFRASPRLESLLAEPFRVGWPFDVELLARYLTMSDPADGPDAARAIYEWPLTEWRDAPGSKVRARDGVRALAELWTLYHLYGREIASRCRPGPSRER